MVMEGGKMYRKGLWTEEEDRILMDYIAVHGKGKWNQVARLTGLKRCGKSCRLRWMNYLSPTVKRGGFSEEEEDLIIRLHKLLGNRWSLIAGRVPGRTDNQVKNHWNTHLSKKLGVKKGTFKVSGSSKTRSSEVEKKPMVASELGSDSSEAPLDGNNGGAGQEEDEDGPKSITGYGSTEWSLSGINESCFGFSDDGFSPSVSGLMDFIDSYSLDFLWHDM